MDSLEISSCDVQVYCRLDPDLDAALAKYILGPPPAP
jgi:hypothetical protein